MIDPSVCFEEIAPDRYLYRTNRLFSRKAYFLSYDEKTAIESLFRQQMIANTAIMTSCSSAIYFRPIPGCLAFAISSISLFINFRRKIKNIIGDREKIPCPKEPSFSIFKRGAKLMTWKEIRKYIGAVITSSFFTAYILYNSIYDPRLYKHQLVWMIIGFVMLVLSFLGLISIFYFIRYKPKN